MDIERRKKVSVELNIAPLIDVVFQLLLFFVLTTSYVTNPGIEVALPKAASAVPVQKEHIELYITKDNAVYCNNEKVTMGSLRKRLENMPSLSKTVILKADKSVELGMVVQVIDVVKQTNIKDLVIATTQEE